MIRFVVVIIGLNQTQFQLLYPCTHLASCKIRAISHITVLISYICKKSMQCQKKDSGQNVPKRVTDFEGWTGLQRLPGAIPSFFQWQRWLQEVKYNPCSWLVETLTVASGPKSQPRALPVRSITSPRPQTRSTLKMKMMWGLRQINYFLFYRQKQIASILLQPSDYLGPVISSLS